MKKSILDALICFVAALAAFTWIGVGMWFYKADGPRLVLHLRDGNPVWPQHPYYLPILIAFRDLVSFLGLSPFRVAMLASALGTALGIGMCRIAFSLLGETRLRANLATLLVATCPAVLLFGCVVEIHGVFFAFAALAFLGFAATDRATHSVQAMAVLGVCTGVACGIAAGVHASGILLPAIYCPWMIARAEKLRASDTRVLAALLIGAAHSATVFTLLDPFGAREFVASGFGRPQGLEYLPMVVFTELLFGLAPIALLAPLTFFAKGNRREIVAYLVAVVPYCIAAMLLLVGEPEFGAYLVPLAIPAAWLCARAIFPLGHAILVGIALVVGGQTLSFFQPGPRPDRFQYNPWSTVPSRTPFGEAIPRPLRDGAGIALCGSARELESVLVLAHNVDPILLDSMSRQPPAAVRAALPLFDTQLAKARAEGQSVWIGADGVQFLRREPDAVLRAGRILLDHLNAKYQFVRVDRTEGLDFFELIPQ